MVVSEEVIKQLPEHERQGVRNIKERVRRGEEEIRGRARQIRNLQEALSKETDPFQRKQIQGHLRNLRRDQATARENVGIEKSNITDQVNRARGGRSAEDRAARRTLTQKDLNRERRIRREGNNTAVQRELARARGKIGEKLRSKGIDPILLGASVNARSNLQTKRERVRNKRREAFLKRASDPRDPITREIARVRGVTNERKRQEAIKEANARNIIFRPSNTNNNTSNSNVSGRLRTTSGVNRGRDNSLSSVSSEQENDSIVTRVDNLNERADSIIKSEAYKRDLLGGGFKGGFRAGPESLARTTLAELTKRGTGLTLKTVEAFENPRETVRSVTNTVTNVAGEVYDFGADLVQEPVKTSIDAKRKAVSFTIGTAKAIKSSVQKDPFAFASRTATDTLTLAAGTKLIKVGNQVRLRIGADKVDPEDVFSSQVLEEGKQFPLATSTEDAVRQFEKARDPVTDDLLVVTASPNKLRGNVASGGPKAQANLEDAGIYVSPYGEGSPAFLRISGENKLPSFTLNPLRPVSDALKTPTVTVFEAQGVKRIPSNVKNQAGFEAVRDFYQDQAGSGNVFITKRSEIGQGTAPRQNLVTTGKADLGGTKISKGQVRREAGTSELEAVVPEGQTFTSVKIPKTITFFEGKPVLIQRARLDVNDDLTPSLPNTRETVSSRTSREVSDLRSSIVDPDRVAVTPSLSGGSVQGSITDPTVSSLSGLQVRSVPRSTISEGEVRVRESPISERPLSDLNSFKTPFDRLRGITPPDSIVRRRSDLRASSSVSRLRSSSRRASTSNRSTSRSNTSSTLSSNILSSPVSNISSTSNASSSNSSSSSSSGSSGGSSTTSTPSRSSFTSSLSRTSALSQASALSSVSQISNVGFGSIKPSTFRRRNEDLGRFDVLVRRSGEFRTISTQKSLSEALRVGSERVRNTAAASFKILPRNNRLQSEKLDTDRALRSLGRAFRESKTESGVFVEKREFRIKTSGELKQITSKGIQASKKKRKKLKIGL